MNAKKVKRKKISSLKNINSLVSKNLNLNKLKVNPVSVIEDTKNKIGNFYSNLKKERAKEKKRLEKKRLLDQKKELIREKKTSSKRKIR